MTAQNTSDMAVRSPMESMIQPFGGVATAVREATKAGNGTTFADNSPMTNLPKAAQVAEICGNLQLTA